KVSQISKLADASAAFSSLAGWSERNLLGNFINLIASTWRLRGYGDYWNYCLVAEGAVDIGAEPEVSLWDLAAPSLLVTEAGARLPTSKAKRALPVVLQSHPMACCTLRFSTHWGETPNSAV